MRFDVVNGDMLLTEARFDSAKATIEPEHAPLETYAPDVRSGAGACATIRQDSPVAVSRTRYSNAQWTTAEARVLVVAPPCWAAACDARSSYAEAPA